MSNRNHMPVLLRRWLARATAATRHGRGEPTNDRDAPDALASGREALAAWFAAEPEQHALAQATLAALALALALARAGPRPLDATAAPDEYGHASFELSILYGLSPKQRGQGYATEAAGRLIAYAFEALQVKRVFADTNRSNVGSINVMKRAGMRVAVHPTQP